MDEIRNSWWKVMIGIIGAILMYQLNTFNTNIKDLTIEVKELVVTTALNSRDIFNHNLNLFELKDRISALEKGSHMATNDRITKTETIKLFDDNRNWIEKYFKRK